MSDMFYSASSFNQPLDNWDVSSVTDMSYMFAWASSFNQPLDNWDVSSVTDMRWMFDGASSLEQDLCEWYDAFGRSTPEVFGMLNNSNCANTSDPDFDSKTYFCGTTEYPTCASVVSANFLYCY
jgi:surface protein